MVEVVITLVGRELLDAVGVDTTAGVVRLEEQSWLVVCDDVVDDVSAIVFVVVELRVGSMDEVGTIMVVFMEVTTDGLVVSDASTMRYDVVDVFVVVIVCFEIEGVIGEAVTVVVSFKV